MADIDDPFKGSDSTVIRPRPGAGRRGAGDTFVPPRSTPSPAPPPYGTSPAFDPLPVAAVARPVVEGLNPLVQAASPVLLLAGRLRHSLSGFDLGSLRRQGMEEIRRFEEAARAAGVQSEVVLVARYALCSTVDEAILSTPWGGQSDWGQQSLLVMLHREAWGGEKFFDMLDRMMKDPARHIDLIELHYLCLAVGFTGRYAVLERGHARLAEVQQSVYRAIRQLRGAPQQELSLQWKGLEDRRHRLVRYLPWWVVGAGVLAALTLSFVIYYAWLGRVAVPTYEALAGVGLETFKRPVPAVNTGLRLKVLLAPEEERGLLTVVEEGGRTRVILVASELFASGSATPSANYLEVLDKVGAAIEQVPGRVLVEGHTDDQPLNSFRYKNNFELSRERAANVVRELQRTVTNPARLEWAGVGSSQPGFTPESLPENRARNRRVEIIHVAGV